MPGSYDIIIVGAGHNGLVAATYLARAGMRVLVLERRELVGGACVTEALWPGFKVSTASYVNSLFRPEIIRDLELGRHGFELLPRSPSSFTPFPDGRFLLMGPDKDLTQRQVAQFSARDAEALPRYEAMLERVADFIEPTLLQTPPNPWSLRPRDLLQLAGLGWRFLKLGRDGPRALEILTGAARPILDRWFESEQLKIALATDAIIGAMASPSMPGTAYVLFHHVMGECNGVRGMWGYVRGGMGGLSDALAAAARAAGAEIRLRSPVAKILTRGASSSWTRRHSRGSSSTKCGRSTMRARRSRSTWRSPSCRPSARSRTAASRPTGTSAARSTSRRRSTTWSRRTTTPSTVALPRTRSSSARSRPSSTRRSLHPAGT